MSKQTTSPTNQQAVQKQTNRNAWVKLAVLVVIVFSTVSLLTASIVIVRMKNANRKLQQQALELEEGNEDLQHYIDNQGTDQGVQDVAKNELGMVDPDTVIYEFD